MRQHFKKFTTPRSVGQTVEGEDVNEYALVHVHMFEYILHKQRAILAHLREVVGRARVCALPLQEILRTQTARRHL